MADELASRRREATRGNYSTDENLRRRMGLLDYAVVGEPQPRLVDLFDWPSDSTVLDVGCGNGLWTAMAADRTSRGRTVGLDQSLGMARAIADRQGPAVAVVGDGQRLPVRDSSVDVVLATWVLYHLPDKDAAFTEIKRVLRPAGRFIAATNSEDNLSTVDELIRVAVQQVVGHEVRDWIEPLDFTLENGQEMLSRWFGHVELQINETAYEVPVAAPIISYVDSLREPITAEVGGLDFESLLGSLGELLQRRLESGPLRFTRRTAFLVARV